jgi:hypothetical protein
VVAVKFYGYVHHSPSPHRYTTHLYTTHLHTAQTFIGQQTLLKMTSYDIKHNNYLVNLLCFMPPETCDILSCKRKTYSATAGPGSRLNRQLLLLVYIGLHGQREIYPCKCRTTPPPRARARTPHVHTTRTHTHTHTLSLN